MPFSTTINANIYTAMILRKPEIHCLEKALNWPDSLIGDEVPAEIENKLLKKSKT